MSSTWLTPAVVRSFSGARQGDATDTASLTMAADAAAEYVETLRPEYRAGEVYTPTASIILGAAMLANRWYARRGSPLGVAGYAELGSSGILRYDPDIARLLGIGTDGGRFVFGAPTGAEYVPPLTQDNVYPDPDDAGILVVESDGASDELGHLEDLGDAFVIDTEGA